MLEKKYNMALFGSLSHGCKDMIREQACKGGEGAIEKSRMEVEGGREGGVKICSQSNGGRGP